MDAKKLGAFIAEIRKERNMTQAELAEKIQVTDKAVSRWERGVGFPDVNLFEPLSDALGISIIELIKAERNAKENISKSDAEKILAETISVSRLKKKQKNTQICIVLIFGIISILIGVITPLSVLIFGLIGIIAVAIAILALKYDNPIGQRTQIVLMFILICLVVLFSAFLIRAKHLNSHMDIDFSAEIKDVTIYYGMQQIVFSEPKQIENIIKTLKSISCHKITDNRMSKMGFFAQIDINYFDGDMLDITFKDENRIAVYRYESYQKYPYIHKYENGQYGIDVNGQYVTVSEYLPETEYKCVSSVLYKSDSDLVSKILSMVQGN